MDASVHLDIGAHCFSELEGLRFLRLFWRRSILEVLASGLSGKIIVLVPFFFWR